MALTSSAKAVLSNLSKTGDKFAKAIVEGTVEVLLSAGTEASNVIKVTGRIANGVGAPLMGVRLVNVKVSGTPTLSDGGAGTVRAGAASTDLWMDTDATGGFDVDVTQGAALAGDYFVTVLTHDGTVALLKITFA